MTETVGAEDPMGYQGLKDPVSKPPLTKGPLMIDEDDDVVLLVELAVVVELDVEVEVEFPK